MALRISSCGSTLTADAKWWKCHQPGHHPSSIIHQKEMGLDSKMASFICDDTLPDTSPHASLPIPSTQVPFPCGPRRPPSCAQALDSLVKFVNRPSAFGESIQPFRISQGIIATFHVDDEVPECSSAQSSGAMEASAAARKAWQLRIGWKKPAHC